MNEEYRGFTIAYNPAFGWYIVGHEDRGHFETAAEAKKEADELLSPRRPDEQPSSSKPRRQHLPRTARQVEQTNTRRSKRALLP